MKRILVTGGSGLLGGNLAKELSAENTVYATYNRNRVSLPDVSFFRTDLTVPGCVGDIGGTSPDAIIHCAALVNLDYCEKDPEAAHEANVTASVNVATAAKQCGARLIHISTDAVFDGARGDYSEEDAPNPINVYGRTKLEAESKVLETHPSSCVVRTNIYGWNKTDKKSLAEWMISRLEDGLELPALKDVRFSPILVNDLAKAIERLIDTGYEGILHVAGSEPCTKLEFAREIAGIFGLDDSLIVPTELSQLGLAAPRGKDISLNVSKAEEVLGMRLPGVREGLERMRALREEGYVEELRRT